MGSFTGLGILSLILGSSALACRGSYYGVNLENVSDIAAKSINLYLLGGASDLALRLLLPGVAEYLAEYPGNKIQVIGSGRHAPDDYRATIREALGSEGIAPDAALPVADNARFVAGDATEPDDLTKLLRAGPVADRRILYFALPPAITLEVVEALHEVDLPEGLMLALEKPFGEDATSARKLNDELLSITGEDNIFRVDHFKAESATRNLTGLVDSNALIAAAWDNRSVAAIDIVYEEALGLEGRADFYEQTGATRDMVQSHLLQTMAQVMTPGGGAGTADLLAAARVDLDTVRRARYTAGEVEGRQLPAYVDEEGVDPANQTETLVQLCLEVDTERWRGVPVTLRTGKAIGQGQQNITVTFHQTGADMETPGARLILPFTDDVFAELNVPDHGDPGGRQRVTLHSDLVPSRLSPYGRVLRAIVAEDASAAVAAEGPALAWELLEPVLSAFESGQIELAEYPAGSGGPVGW